MEHSDFNRRHSFKRALWHATAGEPPASHAFEPDASFDFVVVGAGVAGVVAALRLQQAGARVAIVEADAPGAGATGRSGGFVVPSFSAVRPGVLLQNHRAQTLRLLTAVAGSAETLFRLAEEHAIDCDAGQAGWFQPAHSPEALERIAQDTLIWQSVGADLNMLSATETQERTGVSGYFGSMFAPTGGTIHPVKLVHGLIRAGVMRGLQFFSGAPATSLLRSADRWQVSTPRGALYCDRVLVCTNARSPQLSAGLEKSVVPLRVCQVATRPLQLEQRDRLLGQGQSLSDSRLDLFSYRFDADWRLISGAMPVLPVNSGQRLAERLATRLMQQLGLRTRPDIEHVWFGEASVTTDRLPAIYDIGPGAYALTACNGRGLAMSAVLAQSLAFALLSGNFAELPVEITRPSPATQRSLQILGSRFYPVYGRLRDALGV